MSKKGKHSKQFILWRDMMGRCYNGRHQKKQPTYIGCEVCEKWHNFQVFAKWYNENYYEIQGERVALDKDILYKGNKIYSPGTCVFVPQSINNLFVKRDVDRGEYPIGVSYDNRVDKFKSSCNNANKEHIVLDYYNNPIDAFNEYKRFKELTIKKVADLYKNLIPKNLYNALYKYEVEIND